MTAEVVKLIVSDMDFTLVDNDRNIPEEIFPLVKRLRAQGIRFMVASARHHHNLYVSFKPVADEMGYICDNGAYAEVDGQGLVSRVMDHATIVRLLDVVETIPGVYTMLCTKDAMYYSKTPYYLENPPKDLPENEAFCTIKVPDLREVKEDVYRVALCDPADPRKHSVPLLLEKFGDELNIVATDFESVDIMLPGVNKGSGLAEVQRKLGITPAETMVFGDYLNDIPMLRQAEYSFAMANALDEVKAACNYLAPSNQDKGVIRVVEQYLADPSSLIPQK